MIFMRPFISILIPVLFVSLLTIPLYSEGTGTVILPKGKINHISDTRSEPLTGTHEPLDEQAFKELDFPVPILSVVSR
jgi:hypothetical protein